MKQKKPSVGRPPGKTERGEATQEKLYLAALQTISELGYERATLRAIAERANVRSGLLYKYFPSKRAVVIELSDRLSLQYAQAMAKRTPGSWGDELQAALMTSLSVLHPYRALLSALKPTLLSNREDGVLSPARRETRLRVQLAFEELVAQAKDAPQRPRALGRLFYLLHLAMIVWWLLDLSPGQRATLALLKLVRSVLPVLRLILKLPPAQKALATFDQLYHEALLGESSPEEAKAEPPPG